LGRQTSEGVTAGLFTLTYTALAVGRVPKLHQDRSAIAPITQLTLALGIAWLTFVPW
jgi:hypothetical protein